MLRLLQTTLVFALAILVASRTSALVVVSTDAADHAAAPADDPGWLNVTNQGVYIGNGWVLNAGHVGPGTTTFSNGESFAAQPGTFQFLNNPTGYEATADLGMFRLVGTPSAPSMPIASTTPAVGAKLTLVGYGSAIIPGTSESHWTRTQTSPPPNEHYAYSPSDETNGTFHGYLSNTGGKHWGTNLVEDDEQIEPIGDANHTVPVDTYSGDPTHGETISFFTNFDKLQYTLANPTDSEAQAQSGDSGSGAFLKVGGVWTLVGTTFAIDIEIDQPGGTGGALYGNRTFIADLATYRSQILTIAFVPEASSALFLLVAAATALAARRRFAVANGLARLPSRRS
jgi:hypothetical protein